MTVTSGARVVDVTSDPRWLDLVAHGTETSVFHHPAWLTLLRTAYRYPIEGWCVADAGGRLVAGLPVATVSSRLTGSRLVSLPFSDRCQAAFRDGGHADRERLAEVIDRERRRRGLSLELHGAPPDCCPSTPGDRFFGHLMALPGDVDRARRLLHDTQLRNARRAVRLGVRVRRRTDEAAVAAFFRLHVLTRRRLGVPTQPWRFFRGLVPVLQQGLGFVALAEWEGRAVNAAVYLRWGRTLTYKYGASDHAHSRLRAAALIHTEAVQHAIETGCDTLDFGRTELDNDGLRRFKRQLGGQEVELAYSWLGAAPAARSVRNVSRLQRAAIRKAPPAFGRVLGAAVYRHFG
jgi:hypothetical protein